MRFESRLLQATHFVSRKIKNMRHNTACCYSMRHNADLAQACPNVSLLKRVLARLRRDGTVECVKSGRDAVWEKRGS